MLGELILLPVRISVRATRLWLRAAEETVTVAANATGRIVGIASSRGADAGSGSSADPATQERDAPGQPAAGDGRSSATGVLDRRPSPPPPPAPPAAEETPAEPATSYDTPAEREPAHVSEEPSLVEEFAEPGAEDGAGAEVHIAPPWDGYADMNAKQIVARLSSATPAELAAVQLYESSHRRRQTILNAAQRELRTANGRGSGSQQRG